MPTLVHRRVLPRAPAPDPRAPDAALEQLTWVGWGSVAAAVAALIVPLVPFFTSGGNVPEQLLANLELVLRTVANAAVIALPAALELGVANASRRVPSLFRGAVLLALAQALVIVVDRIPFQLFGEADLLDPASLPNVVERVANLVPVALQVAAAWVMSRGLADVGARPGPAVVFGIPGGAGALWLAGFVMLALPTLVEAFPTYPLLVVLVVLGSAVQVAGLMLTVAVGVRLVAGALGGLRPRRAWRTGAVAGACLAVVPFLQAVPLLALSLTVQGTTLPFSYAALVLDMLGWVLLVSALAAGLGRAGFAPGESRRLVARWVRYPAA